MKKICFIGIDNICFESTFESNFERAFVRLSVRLSVDLHMQLGDNNDILLRGVEKSLVFLGLGKDQPSSLGLGVDDKTCFIRIDNIRFERNFEIAFETNFEGGLPLSPCPVRGSECSGVLTLGNFCTCCAQCAAQRAPLHVG